MPVASASFFQSFTTPVKYSEFTESGKNINDPVEEQDAVIALKPLIEYLEKNLATICNQLPPSMAQAVIEKLWIDTLSVAVNEMVPTLFGSHIHKHLVPRQKSMLQTCLVVFRDFLHGDGGEFGLPFEKLDSPSYIALTELFSFYHAPVSTIQEEYDRALSEGVYKELLLRLVRLLAAKESSDAAWIETQITLRREQSRR